MYPKQCALGHINKFKLLTFISKETQGKIDLSIKY